MIWPFAVTQQQMWLLVSEWLATPAISSVQRKFSWGVHSVAYGGHLYLVCAVCDSTIWRDIHVSKPTFWRSLLTICIFLYTHSSYFKCHCTEYKLLVVEVRILEENKLNATTQHFITAKISGWALKQGNKAHSSLRQSNLQLRNEAAL